jgi:hypothetical protein
VIALRSRVNRRPRGATSTEGAPSAQQRRRR